MKKIVAIALTATISMANLTPVWAASGNQEYANVPEYLSHAFMAAGQVQQYQEKYGISFAEVYQDLSGINFSESWKEEAEQFVDDYIQDYGGGQSSGVNLPSEVDKAKAEALTYVMKCAQANKAQNNSINLEKEAQYLFISHYVDRNDYYWRDKNYRKLLDGASQSGPYGYLAEQLTNTDRTVYNRYLSISGVQSAGQSLGHIAVELNSLYDFKKEVQKGYAVLEKGKKSLDKATSVFGLGCAFTLVDESLTAEDVIINDVLPLGKRIVNFFYSTPGASISNVYDMFMNNPGLQSMYDPVDAEKIVRTALSQVAALTLGGPLSLLVLFRDNAGMYLFDFYAGVFHYATWVVMRSSFSMRYAERYWIYLGLM